MGFYNATVAQLAEQTFRKRQVKGSIPFGGSFSSIIPLCLIVHPLLSSVSQGEQDLEKRLLPKPSLRESAKNISLPSPTTHTT